MDEAFVLLVAAVVTDDDPFCKAFPFATRHAAEEAQQWLQGKLGLQTLIVNDHEPEMEPDQERGEQ